MKTCAYCHMQRPNHRATCPSPRREADALDGGIDVDPGTRCIDSPVAPERSASATGTSESRRALGCRLVASSEAKEGTTLGRSSAHVTPRLSVPPRLSPPPTQTVANAND